MDRLEKTYMDRLEKTYKRYFSIRKSKIIFNILLSSILYPLCFIQMGFHFFETSSIFKMVFIIAMPLLFIISGIINLLISLVIISNTKLLSDAFSNTEKNVISLVNSRLDMLKLKVYIINILFYLIIVLWILFFDKIDDIGTFLFGLLGVGSGITVQNMKLYSMKVEEINMYVDVLGSLE